MVLHKCDLPGADGKDRSSHPRLEIPTLVWLWLSMFVAPYLGAKCIAQLPAPDAVLKQRPSNLSRHLGGGEPVYGEANANSQWPIADGEGRCCCHRGHEGTGA